VGRHRQIGAIRFVEQAVVLVLKRPAAQAGHRYIREIVAGAVGL
jgi:hypothetical protein